MKDRTTNQITAKPIESADAHTIRTFVNRRAKDGSLIYTDDSKAYAHLMNREVVNHSIGEYMREQVPVRESAIANDGGSRRACGAPTASVTGQESVGNSLEMTGLSTLLVAHATRYVDSCRR